MKNIEKAEASLTRINEYSIFYASSRVEKEFEKAFKKIPGDDVLAIKAAIKNLKKDPRQKSKKLKEYGFPGLCHRIRIGRYRVLYDIEDENHKVILHLVGIRNEKTYK